MKCAKTSLGVDPFWFVELVELTRESPPPERPVKHMHTVYKGGPVTRQRPGFETSIKMEHMLVRVSFANVRSFGSRPGSSGLCDYRLVKPIASTSHQEQDCENDLGVGATVKGSSEVQGKNVVRGVAAPGISKMRHAPPDAAHWVYLRHTLIKFKCDTMIINRRLGLLLKRAAASGVEQPQDALLDDSGGVAQPHFPLIPLGFEVLLVQERCWAEVEC
ncbi:hypothetical protein K438DRAFT_1766791 [Mycena galopus ATCC 62051]|nr:hypothetical protein K438DRAFT_1766791 [Mycena galopus ATCC 62051]